MEDEATIENQKQYMETENDNNSLEDVRSSDLSVSVSEDDSDLRNYCFHICTIKFFNTCFQWSLLVILYPVQGKEMFYLVFNLIKFFILKITLIFVS